MRTRATTTLTAGLLLTVLTACSSSDDDKPAAEPPIATAPATSAAPSSAPSSEPPTSDTAALEKAVKDYTAALFSGNAKGYDLVSARCQKQMSETEWTAMAKDAHQQYGAQKATGVTVDQQSGDLARVSYGAGNIPQFDREGQSWVREGGTWRWDACPSTS